MRPMRVRQREAALASFLAAFALIYSFGGDLRIRMGFPTGPVGGFATVAISAAGGFVARKAWLVVRRDGED